MGREGSPEASSLWQVRPLLTSALGLQGEIPALTTLDPDSPHAGHCLNVSPAFLAKVYFFPHLQEKRLFSVAECGECEPRSSLALGSEYPFSKKRVGLCPAPVSQTTAQEGQELQAQGLWGLWTQKW